MAGDRRYGVGFLKWGIVSTVAGVSTFVWWTQRDPERTVPSDPDVVASPSPGDWVERGQRVGNIRFGSQVDVYLGLAGQPLVRRGQRVKAGVTPLARHPSPSAVVEGKPA